MDVTKYQTQLHILYKGDGNTPSSGSTKWTSRLGLLEVGINHWDTQDVKWDGLWVTLADASDGDKTVTASTLAYSTPTDFRELSDWVYVTDSNGQSKKYGVKKAQDAGIYANSSTDVVYVTGNKKTGFKINFTSQPTVGDTINYAYYKEAFVPSAADDVIEMDDPYFAVHYALGKLHEQEGAGDRAQAAYSIAEAKLKRMKKDNIGLPFGQRNTPKDLMNGGFGVGGSKSRFGSNR